jgi:MFS family permease
LFVAAIIPGVIAIALSFFLKDKPTIGAKNSIAKPGIFSFFGYWKIAGKSYKLLIIGLLIFALFNSSDAFLLLALKNNGFSDQFMIKTYIFYNLVYALLSFPLGILADKKGLPVVLISGLVVFALVYFFMGFAVASWQFIILFGMYAVYAAATEGISKAWISNLAMGENLATAIGLYTSLSSICSLLASSLAGFIWFAFGMKTMFILSATGVLISALFLGWMQLNRKFSTN